MELALQSSVLRLRINLLGSAALSAYLVLMFLSYLQASALWRSHPAAPQAVAFFDDLATRFPALALHRFLDGNAAVIVSYSGPLAVVTVAVLLLVLMLRHYDGQLDAGIAALLMRWSVAFAVVCLFAFPVFTQDFWLSMAWGRMLAAGTNPFHNLFTPEDLIGLPLDHFPMVMSYGPAWAILSGAVMAVSGQSLLAAIILFKALLFAAWLGSLFLIARITGKRTLLDRCLAITAFGWMPLGVLQTVAEGHNDIAMIWPALFWLALLLQGRWTAPVALVVSALAKYVTGPLFVVDMIVAWRMHALSWRQFILRLIAPGLLGLGVFAAFFRSLDFFDGTRVISTWHFLQPRDAIAALELTFNISLFPAVYVIAAGFATLVVHQLITLVRRPTPDNIVKAVLAIMSAISFAVIAHLWPWYLVWTVAFAVLLPRWWLSRFVIGVSILAPFTLSFWWIDLFPHSQQWVALAMYAVAGIWCFQTRASAPGGSHVAGARGAHSSVAASPDRG